MTPPFDDLDRRILAVLAGAEGPSGIWPSVPRIAQAAGCCDRTVQRHLRKLEAADLVESVPVFERGGDPEWEARRAAGVTGAAPRRQTSSSYRLTGAELSPGPGDSGYPQTTAQPPVTPVDAVTRRSTQIRGGEGSASPLSAADAGRGVDGAEIAGPPAPAEPRWDIRTELWEDRLERVQVHDPAATWDRDRVITLGDGRRLEGPGQVTVYLHQQAIADDGRTA